MSHSEAIEPPATPDPAPPAASASPTSTGDVPEPPIPSASRAPHWPPTDDDFAVLRTNPTTDAGAVCLLEREIVSAPVAFVGVAYAKNGKLSRRERWRVAWSGTTSLDSAQDYQWRNDRLESISDRDGSITRLQFDSRGLLTKMESESKPGHGVPTTIELQWSVTPIPRSKLAPAYLGSRNSSVSPLPWRLPFTGSVKLDRVQGKASPIRSSGTFQFDSRGWLASKDSKAGGDGRPTGEPGVEWKWEGNRLVERAWATTPFSNKSIVLRGREVFAYDSNGRLIRKQLYGAHANSSTLELDAETRYEHLCVGDFMYDPIWP